VDLRAALVGERRERAAQLGVERAVPGRAGPDRVEARLVADDRAGDLAQARELIG